ncbi:hypothetical protein Tco_1199150 [Tanacetum coccineum]
MGEDEVVHKELGNSLVRAATTASSLEAECQETIGDTIAQTRFENVSKHSNDSLLASGNTLRSDEDRIKLDELMALCTTLQNRVLDLEKTKTTQHIEIPKSSYDKESLGEDASKQGRIDAIDAYKEITLVSAAGDKVSTTSAATTDKCKGILIEPMKKEDQILLDEETALNLQAEFNEEERLAREKAEKEQEANVALIKTWDDIQPKIDVDHQLAKRLQEQEQEELSIEEKATLFQQILKKRRKHFAAKRAEEKRNKPPTKAQQRKIMCTYLKNMEGYKLNDLKLKEFDSIQEMFDRAFKRITKKQKVGDDKETTEIKKLMEIIPDEEEVAIDVILLAVKSPTEVSAAQELQRKYAKCLVLVVHTKADIAMKSITFTLSYFDKPLLFDLDVFSTVIGIERSKDFVSIPPKETMNDGLVTLGLTDGNDTSLSSSDLINSSLVKIKYFSPKWRVLMQYIVKWLGGMQGSHDQQMPISKPSHTVCAGG